MDKPWGGRFNQNSSKLLEEFNASIMVDRELFREDIFGSKIHAQTLCEAQIINEGEKNHIISALNRIEQEISEGNFDFKIADEDIHMAIEKRLIQLIGNIGKKLHTARSRNDQVALDFKLYTRRKNLEIDSLLKNLIKTLLNIAEQHKTTMMPGMTHLQHAQPISLAFHLLAYCFAYKRDLERLRDDFKRNNFSPLGSAAFCGTSYPINRNFSAQKLGFSAPCQNACDGVSERDFALDLLYSISLIMLHTSRFSEELILWSSAEFNFIEISDSFATGSSIMPNKKNPDVCELIRGKTGRAFGNLISLLSTMKSLPLAYNKDMQEDKEVVFNSANNAILSLNVLNEMLKEIKWNKESMLNAAKKGHIIATDLADYLVQKKGVSFRDAHHIIGSVVAHAENKGVDISELSIGELKAIDWRFEIDCLIDLEQSMNAKISLGSSNIASVESQIESLKNWLNNG